MVLDVTLMLMPLILEAAATVCILRDMSYIHKADAVDYGSRGGTDRLVSLCTCRNRDLWLFLDMCVERQSCLLQMYDFTCPAQYKKSKVPYTQRV